MNFRPMLLAVFVSCVLGFIRTRQHESPPILAEQPSQEVRAPSEEGIVAHEEHHAGYLTPEHTMGDRQSPINIVSRRAREESHSAEILYQRSKEHVRNLGKTIEVDWDSGSQLKFDGRIYELVQFHFHTPSEHMLDGLTYPMEIHLVHKGLEDPERLLVVGALFKEGEPNPIVEEILPYVPEHPGERIDASNEMDLSQLFEKDDGYYYYSGSLTTPPYSEVVSWLVLDGVHEASPEQVESVAGIEGNNARHIQDPHARDVAHCLFARTAAATPGRR